MKHSLIEYKKQFKTDDTFEVFHFETGVIEVWTLAMILQEINRDRSQDWLPYNETDWIEGLEGFTEYRLYKKVQK